jgi:preprotein translocase subunit SecE
MRLLDLGMARMAKSERDGGFWSSMLTVGLYKRNQGKLARQLTAAAILIAVGLGAWAMWLTILADLPLAWRYGVAGAVAAVGAWFAYRIVNYPVFADFLADVEGEMVKVSWPGKDELKRATAVVLVTMVILSSLLFIYDVVWQQILRWIRVLQF